MAKKKSPVKGLAHKRSNSSDMEKDFYFVKDVQNMKELQDKKSEQKAKNSAYSQQK